MAKLWCLSAKFANKMQFDVVMLCVDVHKNVTFSNGEIVMFKCKIC